MQDLQDREKAFEKKFQHDEARRFKIAVRAARAMGVWAAGLIGLRGQDAAAYVQSVVDSDLAAPGQDDLFARLCADFAHHHVDMQKRHIVQHYQTVLADIEAFLAAEDEAERIKRDATEQGGL